VVGEGAVEEVFREDVLKAGSEGEGEVEWDGQRRGCGCFFFEEVGRWGGDVCVHMGDV
jgi:hypothetical protein